jgi:hypothetical protein
MKKHKAATGQFVNLTSLVDVVSMNVGILVILAVFMSLLAVFSSSQDSASQGAGAAARESGAGAGGGDESATAARIGTEQPIERLRIPWTHATNKQTLFFALHGNRLQYVDMKAVYEQLLSKAPGRRDAAPSLTIPGMKTRFFPVTNQVFCLEFKPDAGAGESLDAAKRPGSALQRVMSTYARDSFVYFFWVGGDSFESFRELRKHLTDRQFEVGWKPVAKDAALEVCNGFEGSNTFQPQ